MYIYTVYRRLIKFYRRVTKIHLRLIMFHRRQIIFQLDCLCSIAGWVFSNSTDFVPIQDDYVPTLIMLEQQLYIHEYTTESDLSVVNDSSTGVKWSDILSQRSQLLYFLFIREYLSISSILYHVLQYLRGDWVSLLWFWKRFVSTSSRNEIIWKEGNGGELYLLTILD
jgi:hypothetical protein